MIEICVGQSEEVWASYVATSNSSMTSVEVTETGTFYCSPVWFNQPGDKVFIYSPFGHPCMIVGLRVSFSCSGIAKPTLHSKKTIMTRNFECPLFKKEEIKIEQEDSNSDGESDLEKDQSPEKGPGLSKIIIPGVLKKYLELKAPSSKK